MNAPIHTSFQAIGTFGSHLHDIGSAPRYMNVPQFVVPWKRRQLLTEATPWPR